MPRSKFAVFSVHGDFYHFNDPGLVALFMFDKPTDTWSVYKWWEDDWHLVSIEEGMALPQLKNAFSDPEV